jgi:flagellar biogenesis protein FliO
VTSYASYVLETLVTLVAVSALAFVMLYGARRAGVGRGSAGAGLTLVGRLAIDSRRSVVLVRVAEQIFVLGVSEAGLTKLGEVPAKDLPEQPAAPQSPFAAVLEHATGRKKEEAP